MVRMSEKEIAEARRAGISGSLLVAIIQGWKISPEDMEEIRGYGKVYVPSYVKDDGTVVKPQLRALPGRGEGRSCK